MAKTIRSHPTAHFVLPEVIFWTTLIFSKFGPNMDLHFLHFPTFLQVKRLAPKGKQMRMDHPFILVFLSKFHGIYNVCFIWGPVFLPAGRLDNEENIGPFWGHFFENKRVVKKVGLGRTKGDVGCDRMVFAINSSLFLMKFNPQNNKWSLDKGQKTTNPLIPY